MRRVLLVLVAMVLFPIQLRGQGLSCSDFTIGANQQIATCNAMLNNFSGALSSNYKIMPADRSRYNLYINRGAAYARSGDNIRARADFQRAVNLATEALEEGGKPLLVEYNGSCWARAVANIELDVALTHCNEAVRLAPDEAFVLDSRAFLHLRMRKSEDALRDYDAALQIRPNYGSSLYGRGIAKFRLGDIEGAKADLFLAETLRPGTRAEFTAFGVAD